ncbi:MAG: glutamate decarboxylase 4-like [Solirubrobacterales bacterium]|jgi:glutamate decarboxylase|nr:glutamate decarboxylase 4-like [Solirubrobacterales bacterium]
MRNLRDVGDELQLSYAARYSTDGIPKFEVPAGPMPARAAYQLVSDELALDGNPKQNLASFVTTWMEPEADQLAKEVLDKNLVDKDEYPRTEVIHRRVCAMLGSLLNAPADCTPVGTATVGSSEAIMLGLVAHRAAWRKRGGKGTPNIVCSGLVHTCWEKAAVYFDMELRQVPPEPGRYVLDAERVKALVDENTVAVGAILGNTFTGEVDDVAGIDEMLRSLPYEVPIHVDAASGGFVAPFLVPELAWDFRLERVKSINISNHKFGLVYPGMGTVLFRDESDVDDSLVFHITYLGGDAPTFSLNFSQASQGVVLQYYNFLRLGRSGYGEVMAAIDANAKALRAELRNLDAFEMIGEETFMPVIAVALKDGAKRDVFELSARIRETGWIVPAYRLPANAQDVAVLRMVVRESISRDMIDQLIEDLRHALGRASGALEPGQPRRPIC